MPLSRFWRRNRWDAERARELESHLAIETDHNVARGLTPAEARLAAERKLGSANRIREEIYDMNTLAIVESTWRDARHALRSFRRSPGFTAVAIVTFALGIGANAAMFSMVYAVLWRPLPFAAPDRLVTVAESPAGSGRMTYASLPNYRDWREQATAFESMAAYTDAAFNLTADDGRPERLNGYELSASLFGTLGRRPLIGRDFSADDDRAGAAPVAILAHAFWRRRFAADPRIIGRRLVLNNRAVTVVGVMPPGFQFPVQPEPIDLWIPIEPDDFPQMRLRDGRLINVIGRLRSGATLEMAQSELTGIASRLERAYPRANAGWTAVALPLKERFVGSYRFALLTLFAAVGFVLLIACANLTNLTLARYTDRRRELAVRTALGAGRVRLFRQLAVEQLLLAAAGGAAGVAAFVWVRNGVAAIAPPSVGHLVDRGLDWQTAAFAVALSVVAALLVGLWPSIEVWRSRLEAPLRDRGVVAAAGSSRVRGTLVAAEIALAMVLLAGAGLTAKSLAFLIAVDPGFDPEHLIGFDLDLPRQGYTTAERQAAFFREAVARARAIPSIDRAAVSFPTPLGSPVAFPIRLEGADERGRLAAQYFTVSADYFRTLRIPLRRGRVFDDGDRAGTLPVLIVNEAMVKRYWPDRDPIGQRVTVVDRNHEDAETVRTIVGVVGDVRHPTLERPSPPQIYTPFDQAPSLWAALIVSTGVASGIGEQVAAGIASVDRNVPVDRTFSMAKRVQETMAPRRFVAVLLGGFAALAALLTMVGIGGVTAYAVAQRRHEIGVRLALGATPRQILALVLGTTLRPALAGTVVGAAAAIAGTRVLRTLLFGVTPFDPSTFVAAALALAVVVILAVVAPARRALRVDPLVALRDE